MVWPFRRKAKQSPPLWSFGPNDPFTTRMAMEHLIALGASGSGKTSTLAHLMSGMMRDGWGMLILPAKGDDADLIQELARENGRESDVRMVEPDSGFVFDFITHEIKSRGGSVEGATQLTGDMVDVSTRTSQSNNRDPFWPMAAMRTINAAMTLIHWSYDSCPPNALFKFVASLPYSAEQLETEEWKSGFCSQTLIAAAAKDGYMENIDLDMAARFVLDEFPRYGDKMASGVAATAMVVLTKFIQGSIRGLVNGETNISPDDVLVDRRLVVVNTPPLVYREPGRFHQLCWKLSFLRSAMRRELGPNTIPVCLWQDEYQLHAVPSLDSLAQAVARSLSLSIVAATQNFPLLHTALGSKEDALALLGNFGTRLMFANSCPETNELSAKTFGESLHQFPNGSWPTGDFDLVSDIFGLDQQDRKGSIGFNSQMRPDVLPAEFTRLEKGGPPHNTVSAYVYQNGRKFSNGKTWMKAAFQQRR